MSDKATDDLDDLMDDLLDDEDCEGKSPPVLELERASPDEKLNEALARTAIRPTVGAATTLIRLGKGKYGGLELMPLIDALSAQTDAVIGGDLRRGEAMLVAQAHTLDSIYNSLIQRAVANADAGYLKATDSFLKMAFRAQSQCRSTWEAVSAIKNPPVIGYAKQANFGVNQQVNNDSRVEKTENPPTELSGGPNELRENPGAPRIEKKADSTLETLGEVHRAEITGGEG